MTIVPCTLREANAFVRAHHRHHGPTVGHKFSVAVSHEEAIVGVAIAGRPIARMLDDGQTLEVTRACTDETPNACSMLYAACWRAARALGFRRLVTYTLASESGTSLRAAGWKFVSETSGGSWSRARRARTDKHPLEKKHRWEMVST